MSRSFRRHGAGIRMQLAAGEVALLRSMRDGLRAVLEDGAPDDPVVARLFPAAVSGDAEADEELRRLLRDELLTARLSALDDLHALLEQGRSSRGGLRVDLDAEQAVLVLGVLNDLRLAIGARVGIEQLEREQLPTDEATTQRLAVMDHLGWLQEQLLAVLDPPSVQVHHDTGLEEP